MVGEFDDEIDLRVYDDPEVKEVKKNSLDGFAKGEEGVDDDTSITRLDGMNDVAKWGD